MNYSFFTNRKILFLLIYLLFSINVFAQIEDLEDEMVDYQYWVDYNANYDLEKNFKLYGDAGWRIISPHLWTRYFVRPAISYTHFPNIKTKRPLKLEYHFGIGLFYTDFTNISNHLEIRPFQGINIEWATFKQLQISHYIRLEEQFDYFNNSWDIGLRARYMFAGVYEWQNENWKTLNNFYLPFHIEFFWNFDEAIGFNDLIRFTLGLGYIVNPEWKIEFSPSYHRRKFDIENTFETNDFVFRLRVFHSLN